MTTSALFWNIWGHRHPEGIHRHIESLGSELVVACLTEVTSMRRLYDPIPRVHTSTDLAEPPSSINGLEQLTATFGGQFDIAYNTPQHRTWRCEVTGTKYDGIGFGSALLIKKGLEVVAIGHHPVLAGMPNNKERVLQYVVYRKDGNTYIVAHLHGVWIKGNTKGDDPLRDRQSRIVLDFLLTLTRAYGTGHVVFGGDLNLDLNTKALRILERGGGLELRYRNLIRKYKIANTRTPAYRKYGQPDASRYADYVLVSPEVEVHDFKVMNHVTASDHAPLLVKFS